MIGIRALASYLPTNFIDNIQQGKSFGESEDFIRKKIGALRLPKKETEEDTSDLAVRAVEGLIKKNGLLLEQIDALVVVTQNGDGGRLPHTSAIVQDKLSLPKTVAAFDLSLGCSGYVYGLFALKGFLETSGLKNGVLVTADPYSKVINPADRVTALLFGDAASATWLGEEAEWDIGHPLYLTDGSGADYLFVQNGILSMNGRQIFNFAASHVPAQILQVIEREGLQQQDIDIYCLHQGSAAIVKAVARHFPEVKDRFTLDMSETGNTVSSSIPLLLENVLIRPEIGRILLCGFGVGLSLATTIITRKGDGHD